MSRILLIVFAATLLFGCKKGENDPSFSLKSRKARLTGNWVAESATWTKNDTTWVFDGVDLEILDTASIDKYGYSLTIQFVSTGEYTFATTTTYADSYIDTTLTGVSCDNTETGLWNFTGGAGSTKTKSQLLLLSSKIEKICSNMAVNINTISITGQNEGLVYNIDRLSDKELTLIYNREIATPNGTIIETGKIKLTKEDD